MLNFPDSTNFLKAIEPRAPEAPAMATFLIADMLKDRSGTMWVDNKIDGGFMGGNRSWYDVALQMYDGNELSGLNEEF